MTPSAFYSYELKAIKLRLSLATGGKWSYHKSEQRFSVKGSVTNSQGRIMNVCSIPFEGEIKLINKRMPQMEADADFIAHSKSDIERLILEVERLKKKP